MKNAQIWGYFRKPHFIRMWVKFSSTPTKATPAPTSGLLLRSAKSFWGLKLYCMVFFPADYKPTAKTTERLVWLTHGELSNSFMERYRAAAAIWEGRRWTMSYSVIVSSIRYLASVCFVASTWLQSTSREQWRKCWQAWINKNNNNKKISHTFISHSLNKKITSRWRPVKQNHSSLPLKSRMC